MMKLAVGIDDVDHLVRAQKARERRLGRRVHQTRMVPRRRADLLDGGSIYWVIRGLLRVRQRIAAIEEGLDDSGRACARLVLDGELVRVEPRPQRAFQGWRYLAPGDAPRDLGQRGGAEELPAELWAELRALGLL